jgi:hypothetical protein
MRYNRQVPLHLTATRATPILVLETPTTTLGSTRRPSVLFQHPGSYVKGFDGFSRNFGR